MPVGVEIPKEMIRLGWIRISSTSNPPRASTEARISRQRAPLLQRRFQIAEVMISSVTH